MLSSAFPGQQCGSITNTRSEPPPHGQLMCALPQCVRTNFTEADCTNFAGTFQVGQSPNDFFDRTFDFAAMNVDKDRSSLTPSRRRELSIACLEVGWGVVRCSAAQSHA